MEIEREMKKENHWKKVTEKPWIVGKNGETAGTIIYYEVGSRKNYIAWHKEKDTFMCWIGKDQINV